MSVRQILLSFLSGVVLFLISGCVIPESNHVEPEYHILFHHGSDNNHSSTESPSFHLREVNLPSYLEDNRIIQRSNTSSLIYRENDRWGEPLSEGIARVMALNIAQGLKTLNYSSYPHRPKPSCLYEFSITVLSFEKVNNNETKGEFIVDIYNKNKIVKQLKLSHMHRFDGDEMSDEIRALSQVLNSTCQEISNEINQMALTQLYVARIDQLDFTDGSVEEIIQTLRNSFSKTYNRKDIDFKISISHQDYRKKLTLSFSNESLFDICETVARLAGLRFSYSGSCFNFSDN